MTYDVSSVDEYIEVIPEEHRAAFQRLRELIRSNLPAGFEECLSYGVPAFSVPLSIYPAGYHCRPEEPLPFISLASQKSFIGLYHMGIYSRPDLLRWFEEEYSKLGIGKIDMGKSCVRLKKMDKIPYLLIGELCTKITAKEWIAVYEGRLKR